MITAILLLQILILLMVADVWAHRFTVRQMAKALADGIDRAVLLVEQVRSQQEVSEMTADRISEGVDLLIQI